MAAVSEGGAGEVETTENRDAPSENKRFRTIVVHDIRHPGGWMNNRQFQKLLNRAASFTVSFSREEDADERQIKLGSIEMLFNTPAFARDAFTAIQKLIIDGKRPTTLVDPEFFSADLATSTAQFFELSDDGRILFLLNLPKSIDEHIISHWFNGETPVHFSTLAMPQNPDLLQAEVLLESVEAAQNVAKGNQEFEINLDDVDYKAVLLTPKEYASYSRMEDVRNKKLAAQAQQPTVSQPLQAPEIDEDVVLSRLMEIIEERRLNWAEINDKVELYELCDAVSAEYNGIPDSILKPAMGSALQRHLNRTDIHWMREQIEQLLGMWKAEIMCEEHYERDSFVPMETVDYKPEVMAEKTESQKKGSQKRKKQARIQMGVGSFLSANRNRLIVENGEVDMSSDEDGNVVIGGEALSFDSWARITKTKASGVLRANDDEKKESGNGGLSKKQQRLARAVQGMNHTEWKEWKHERTEQRRAEKKQRIMNKGAMETTNPEDVVPEGSEHEAGEPSEPAQKKDLDEGEIDSEEERKEAVTAKRKKLAAKSSSDSSSTSSSSSSEDDPDGPVDARKRRKMRRKKERKNPRAIAQSQACLNPQFKAMFENRKAIIAQMSPAHKATFANALQQIIQNNSAISQAKASQVISSMMSGFN
uniref:Uncharacterized protein n=1 Tax=Caenorhabditis japonica TaxID=281687 RepID=A0A8R1DJ23_CAEJA